MKTIFTNAFILFFICSLQAQNKDAGLLFDGIDDYVKVPHHTSLNLGRSAFTVEALIQADTGNKGTVAPTIFSKKGVAGSSLDGFNFWLTDKGFIGIQMEGTSYAGGGFGPGGNPGVPAKDLRDGLCHHVAYTREVGGVQDTINGYQDGALIRKSRKAALLADISNSIDLWIGWSEDDSVTANVYQFKGIIKEIRIWNFAKTEAQIYADKGKHMVGNEAGLIAYWRLDENAGSTVKDCGPNGNNGKLMKGTGWGSFCANYLDAIPAGCNNVPTGIENESDNSSVFIYPNPATTAIKVSGLEDSRIDQVRVYEVTGRQVLIQNWDGKDELNLSHLTNGLYLIKLSYEGNSVFESRFSKN
ncbi:MAG TPA: hypothetical protein DCX54_12600 [Flavobacteriales bacterium]|nr:hypothetical protein [Flavobacteriales bacterium]